MIVNTKQLNELMQHDLTKIDVSGLQKGYDNLYIWPYKPFVIIKHFSTSTSLFYVLLLNCSACSSCISNCINGDMFLPSTSIHIHLSTSNYLEDGTFTFQGHLFINYLGVKFAQRQNNHLIAETVIGTLGNTFR